MIKQTGGALLGKGSYACTFSPVPQCAAAGSTAGSGSVAKVSVQDMTAEIATGRTLMGLKGGRNYFALPTSSCTPRLPITDPDAGKCHILKKNKPLTMAAMPDAGKSLTAWIRDHGNSSAELRTMLAHLLRGMVLYQQAGFVHNDLHGGNIMVGFDGIARYIDFGQGFRPASLRIWEDLNLGRRFAAEYVWLAPELHAIRAGSDGAAIARLYGKIPEYKQLEAAFPDRAHFTEVLPVVARRIGDTEPVTWMRTNAFKIDWWRLGITFWQIWRRLRSRSPDATLDRVIRGLTEFDPARRMNPSVALRLLFSDRARSGASSRSRKQTQKLHRTHRQSVKARRS